MTRVYVTEPEVIDMKVVRAVLKGANIDVSLGDTVFTNSQAQNYDALLIRTATRIDRDIKRHFPYIKSIVRVGTGLDNIDLNYCKAANISIYNSPGANADAVSDYTVAMMLYGLRKLQLLNERAIKTWDRFIFLGNSMTEQIIGIVGFGHIGKQLHKKLSGFACKEFYVYDPYLSARDMPDENTRFSSIEELLQKSSIISLHLPLTPETKHLINSKALALLRDGAILINASRGGIVDEDAVLKALEGQQLTYIADAVEGEPNVNPGLLTHKDVIITPHIASLTIESDKTMIRAALANFINGHAFLY